MFWKILEWLVAFLLGYGSDRWIAPAIEKRLDAIAKSRARSRSTRERLPEPPQGFWMFRLGNVEIPSMNLLGSPESPFESTEVNVDYRPVMAHLEEGYPEELREALPYLEKSYLERYGDEDWTNNEMPRLVSFQQGGETSEDARGELRLSTELTTFFTFLATNRSLEAAVLPAAGGLKRFTTVATLRDLYVRMPYQIESSVLANPLSVHVIVISRSLEQEPMSQVVVRKRSDHLPLFPGAWQSSASGFVMRAHRDEAGAPSLFVAACEEARQEISDSLVADAGDYRLIGLAVNWEDLDLNFYGFLETGIPVTRLLGSHRRDDYEGTLSSIPFEPASVLQHVVRHRWEPMGALAICSALLAHFPRRDVEALAREVPAKKWHDFLESGG